MFLLHCSFQLGKSSGGGGGAGGMHGSSLVGYTVKKSKVFNS